MTVAEEIDAVKFLLASFSRFLNNETARQIAIKAEAVNNESIHVYSTFSVQNLTLQLKFLQDQLSGGDGGRRGPTHTNIFHFQSDVTKRVPLLANFYDFSARVKQEFEHELAGQESHIYRFPSLVIDINSREKIDSQQAYDNLLASMNQTDTSSPMPSVLVWSLNKPISPSHNGIEDLIGCSTISEMCLIGQDYTCMACKYAGDKQKCHACRILEDEECADMSQEQLQAVLNECKIIRLDDLTNYISLCDVCNNDFFRHQLLGIGIDEDRNSYKWIVKAAAMNRETPAGGTYGDIVHNKPLQFKYAQQKPPLGLVEHRLKRFQERKVLAASLKRKWFSHI